MNIGLRTILILFFVFNYVHLFGQEIKVDVLIHARVDTSDKEVKNVAKLWINYLNSAPDSLRDNPYWNSVEKLKYPNFDFSVPYLYQFSSKDLLKVFKPTILSIEKEADNYCIRTLFSAEGLQDNNRNVNPWCITKLYAVKENGDWKLKNALPILTDHWLRKRIGKITFVYPPNHEFNKDLAIKANRFCNEIVEKFNFPNWEPFNFYITENSDEMGKLLNFDFYFAGYTTGVGMYENRVLFSGMNSEFYPHEFIHLILPKHARHWIIEEGVATWLGGQQGKSFEESAIILASELAKNKEVTFSDILSKKWGWQYAAFYTSGAILCNAAYEKGGVALLSNLLKLGNDNFEVNLCQLFQVDVKDFDAFYRAEVKRVGKIE